MDNNLIMVESKNAINAAKFISEYCRLKEIVEKDDGIIVEKYIPTVDMYTLSLNPESGAIEEAKIVEFSVHRNITMYKISDIKNSFKPFNASDDHSLIIYDEVLDSYEKISPKEILELPLNIKSKMYFVKVDPKTKEKELIPLTRIKIGKLPGKHIGYDMTLDKNFTFIANDIVVQDTMAQYAVNTYDSRRALFEKRIHSDSQLYYLRNDSFIHKLRHEYLYALYQLSQTKYIEQIIEIKEPKDFKPDNKILFIEDIKKYGVKIESLDNQIIPYGLMYINYVLFNIKQHNKLFLTETDINKKKVTKVNDAIIRYLEEIENIEYEKDPHKFGRRYLDLLHTLMIELSKFSYNNYVTPKLHIKDYITPIGSNIGEKLRNIPNEPIFGLYFMKRFSDEIFKLLEKEETNLWKIYQSGARASREQIEQTIFSKGFLADPNNIVLNEPVRHSLNKGLSKKELFISAYGSRKGEIDKQAQTPRSGFLERIGLFNLPFIVIEDTVEDCGTDKYFRVYIKNENYAKSFIGRYIKFDPNDEEEIFITKDNYEDIIDRDIYVRSPITCKLGHFKVCKKCGAFNSIEKRKQLGLLSVQYITERFTQLILRTFHTSGKAIIKIPYEIIDRYQPKLLENGRIKINKGNVETLLREINQYLNEKGYTYTITARDLNEEENTFIPVGNGKLINDDIVSKIEFIEKVIRRKMEDISLPDAYEKIMDTLLEIELFKSVMIETILAPLWFKKELVGKATSSEDADIQQNAVINNTLRYSLINSKDIKTVNEMDYSEYVKLSLPIAAALLSPIIQLSFEPNKKTIKRLLTESKSEHISTIFEKLFV